MIPSSAARLREATVDAFPTGSFVVALSGGADSAVAAWLSTQVAGGLPRAVFVHHGWPASDSMREAALAVAERLGIRCDVVRVGVTTSEGDARRMRLAALESAADGDAVVTGHNADDLAETAILNLARGAGPVGRAGIPRHRPPYVRPLLGFSRDDLRDVANQLGLPFADDPANFDQRPRNVIRHEVMPRLEAVVPGAPAGVARSAVLAAADEGLIDERSVAVRIIIERDAALIPAAALIMLPEPVATRIARRALRLLRPPYAGDHRQVAAVVQGAGGAARDIGDGLRVVREGPHVAIVDTARLGPAPAATTLTCPGEVDFDRHHLTAQKVDRAAVPRRGRSTAQLDAGVADNLVVRNHVAGERIDIGGGHKLVADAMAEAGVPVRLRSTWPVVVVHGKIAWIAGVRPAAWARPQPGASRILQLTTARHECSTM